MTISCTVAVTGASARPAISAPLLRLVLILSGSLLLTILFFHPWLAHLSAALIGPPEDNMQDFWNSWHAVTANGWKDFLHTSQIRYPQGASLAYHSFSWTQLFALGLLSKLFGSDLATLTALHNITLLATFPLAATAMFYLARHLLGEVPGRDAGAAFAAFIFAFNPWHVAQTMHHAHVAAIEFLPIFVLCYLLALERKSRAWLFAAAVMQALNALSGWYFFFYAFYFMLFHLLVLRLREGKWPRGWPLILPGLCSGLAALLLAPWLVPMLTSSPSSIAVYFGSNLYVADLLALVAFPPTHLLAQYGHGVYAALTGNAWEGTVYLGLANLAFLIWALTRKGKTPLLRYAVGGMIFFAVIAGGETLHVGGHVTPLHLPGLVLAKLPFFSNVRTPARAIVFVYLFLGIALAQASVMVWRNPKPVARAFLATAAVLIVLDFTPAQLASTPTACPPVLQVIAKDGAAFGVLDLPRSYDNGNAFMMLSACHGKPIVQGETSRRLSFTLGDWLETRDLAAQQRQLEAARVKYIVLHEPQGNLFAWTQGNGIRADYDKTYRKVGQDKGLTLLRVY